VGTGSSQKKGGEGESDVGKQPPSSFLRCWRSSERGREAGEEGSARLASFAAALSRSHGGRGSKEKGRAGEGTEGRRWRRCGLPVRSGGAVERARCGAERASALQAERARRSGWTGRREARSVGLGPSDASGRPTCIITGVINKGIAL
jgi:hypothetical protein